MKLAIYDFDGTYVNVQTVPHVFKLWKQLGYDKKAYKKHFGVIKSWYMLHKLKLLWDKETFRKNAMAKTIDLLHSLNDAELEVFVNQLYQSLKPHINQDMKQQLKKDIENGYETVLLSGSFDIMLKPFINEGFHYVIGTTSKHSFKRLSSKEVSIIIKDKKVEAIKSHINNRRITHSKAYADSYYDFPVLSYVKEGICYHPDDQLRHICEVQQLTIIDTPNSKP